MRDEYDVVIVGAGSSGCALAARLSEAPDRSVLLLEAGPSFATLEAFPAEILDGYAGGAVHAGHPNNWSFLVSLTQDVAYPVPRGKIVGGSSSLNGTYFMRGAREDFDRWQRLGNDEWSYEQVLPFFTRLETDHDYGDSPLHGATGPMPVSRHLDAPLHPLSEAFLAGCSELGLVEQPDRNATGEPGYGRVPLNLLGGVRVNTAIAYLVEASSRPNLTVLGDALVRRVVLEATRAVGVEVEVGGRSSVIRAGEVVLSAGAFKSPHLLLLSGIGPADELRAHGIPVVQELRGVGGNLADHPSVNVEYAPARDLVRERGTPMIQAGLSVATDGSPVGDIEVLCSTVARRGDSRQSFVLEVLLQQEESAGEVRLASSDPHVQPEIRCNYLTEEPDLARLSAGVELTAELLRTSSFRGLLKERTQPSGADLASRGSLERWTRARIGTAFHATGSCRMGPAGDPAAVVDQRCRVHGVERLRVVDGSIMPSITSHGPAATAVMIGERAAAFFDD